MFKHCVIVFFVSMVPLIELRGAIPYGVAFGLPLWLTYLIAIAGNMLPVPVIYFLHEKYLYGGEIRGISENFSPFAWKKGRKPGVSSRPKPAADCTGRCCCS